MFSFALDHLHLGVTHLIDGRWFSHLAQMWRPVHFVGLRRRSAAVRCLRPRRICRSGRRRAGPGLRLFVRNDNGASAATGERSGLPDEERRLMLADVCRESDVVDRHRRLGIRSGGGRSRRFRLSSPVFLVSFLRRSIRSAHYNRTTVPATCYHPLRDRLRRRLVVFAASRTTDLIRRC